MDTTAINTEEQARIAAQEKYKTLLEWASRGAVEFGRYSWGDWHYEDSTIAIQYSSETDHVKVEVRLSPEWDAEKNTTLVFDGFQYGKVVEVRAYRPGQWEQRLDEIGTEAQLRMDERARKTKAAEDANFAPVDDAALFVEPLDLTPKPKPAAQSTAWDQLLEALRAIIVEVIEENRPYEP